ncbi:hypothetical protein JQ604_15100 [Bradyrhizobium jicamae]|uniref:hypothetical protein n=1 Tax=Bradyrhizobium jicamae TaxID=280332 RepID=UPI001BAD7DE0|nr:hypothetical protein [Bradyrhizobium jicamae]MBR0753514.1 hypothetical protein [Bradyrhizobium jicamae]
MVELQRVEIIFGNTLKIMEVTEEPPRGRSEIKLTFEQFTVTAEGNHVMYTLPVDHSVLMQVSYVDARGNPATIDGDVAWASSDEAIASVQVDLQDSTICRAVPMGGMGQVQITATCDADLGEGTRELITICDIQVVGGEAVAGSIQPLGEPTPIEPPQRK